MILIQDQIDSDIKDAMRAKAADKLSVLRLLKAALKNASIEKGGADAKLDDPESMAVIRKQVKQRQDSVEGFEKGGRPELAAKEKAEMEILNTYLPKALSESELNAIVADAIAETGATNKTQMGIVMKVATAKAAGRVDGKTLSQAVQKALA
ncbi:MAG: GatB/YqeY domain-containing protein [Chthoniobacterales bacterium]